MRFSFILSILFVSEGFASSSIVRQKRDLLTIRNFMYNLLGLNYNLPVTRFIVRRPRIGNIYRVIDDDFYLRGIPDYYLSGMRSRNYQRTAPVYQVHGYRGRKEENDYPKPLKSANDIKPSSVERLSKERDDDLSNVANVQKKIPSTPLYIQNRLNKLNTVYLPVTSDRINQPVIQSPYNLNTILLHPGAGEVHVSKYPLVRTSYNDYSIIGEKLNASKIQSPSLSPLNELVGLKPTSPVTQTAASEITERSKAKINSPDVPKKTIKFSEPVPSKYSYKNVNHMQPDKNTAVKFDNTLSTSTTEAESATKRVPFRTSNRDFFLLPPIDKNDPLLRNRDNTYKANNQDKGFPRNKSTPIDEPYTNKQDDQSKVKNSYEHRGDIPASFLQ